MTTRKAAATSHEAPNTTTPVDMDCRGDIHVICLGDSGGPIEDNCTGLLIRAASTNWSRNSILAVDSGSHLGPLIRILESSFPRFAPCKPESSPPTILTSGPFAGLPFPYASARANAAHLLREHMRTYLITHPHLDHLSGFVINTAALQKTTKPKRLAALPFVISAMKKHIFNDIIWPNLTDEEGGVGFISFSRLREGGTRALGEGETRGYIEVCNGLTVKAFRISHGTCASTPAPTPGVPDSLRRASLSSDASSLPHPAHLRRGTYSTALDTPPFSAHSSTHHAFEPPSPLLDERTVDSSACFIRADDAGKEVLLFGDVEPDSLSFVPRNHLVWAEAASKVASGALRAIFIECSYSDIQPDTLLFGHLCPRHLIDELLVLATMVSERRAGRVGGLGKRRLGSVEEGEKRRKSSLGGVERLGKGPLDGVKVVVIHVKDTMADGESVGETILKELEEHETRLKKDGRGLGCGFDVAIAGKSYWF